jgi:hypothetical protein
MGARAYWSVVDGPFSEEGPSSPTATLVDHFVTAQTFAIIHLRCSESSESRVESKRQGNSLPFVQTLRLNVFFKQGTWEGLNAAVRFQQLLLEALAIGEREKSAVLIGLATAGLKPNR